MRKPTKRCPNIPSVKEKVKTAKKNNPIFVFSHEPCIAYNGEKGLDTAKNLRN